MLAPASKWPGLQDSGSEVGSFLRIYALKYGIKYHDTEGGLIRMIRSCLFLRRWPEAVGTGGKCDSASYRLVCVE